MGTKTHPTLPAYRRIQSEIQALIESGKLKVGDTVPSERDLARTRGVSLMTARHALRELDLEGLVERHRGSGTFVAPPKIHFNALVSFSEQMASRGLVARSRVLNLRVGECQPEIAARLALAADSPLVKLERLRQANGQPFALEVCYFSAQQFPNFRRVQLERLSLFTLLEQDYGIALAHADEEVDATPADPRTAKLLQVPIGAPILRIRQVLYGHSGKPIAYTLALYRSDRHSLQVRRYR